ncbi:amidohydrolase family protein [Rathayibacter soli]|uniref:amidohydrolase family protein n=1 Tax=Rathayibacter soli TaxID=3144168 RepID=UPI0027E538A3|nr:amidohydrolase family protein [Glaciibacter superstes]
MNAPVDLLIVNAVVVNSTHTMAGHIAVKAGRICAIYDVHTRPELLPLAGRILDAAGKLVIPGGVDGHCHVEQVTGPYKTRDTFESTSIAALWGGTTTIIDFGIPADRSESPLHAAEHKMNLAQVARCDVGLHGCVLKWDETVPAQLEAMAAHGIRSVKLYTTNRNSTMADDDTIIKVMKEMVRLDGLVYVHAEHDPIIFDCTESSTSLGLTSIENLNHTRPELSETASVRETLAMAEYTGAAVYYVHQSTPEAVRLVQDARSRGMIAYSETCPHYLMCDERVYDLPAAERFACCPPMRGIESVHLLLERAVRGDVDTISSDHSCYDMAQKKSHKDDINFMPYGLPGVETRMPAAFTALVKERGMSMQQFVNVFAAGPARINGLQNKGVIAAGYDADFVIFDPKEVRTVFGAALHMGTDFSPFDGMELAGWPNTVVSAGRVVLEDGQFIDPGPVGRFLKRQGVRESAQLSDGRQTIADLLATGGH